MQVPQTRIQIEEAQEQGFKEGSEVKIELKITVTTPDFMEHEICYSDIEAKCSDIETAFQDLDDHARAAEERWIPNLISEKFAEYLELEGEDAE